MKDKLIRFAASSDLKERFVEYCTKSNTTMSNVLIDYITTLLSKSTEILPAEEKNSVGSIVSEVLPREESDPKDCVAEILPAEEETPALTKTYFCPWCGMDITNKSGSDKLFHIKNCKNSQNE